MREAPHESGRNKVDRVGPWRGGRITMRPYRSVPQNDVDARSPRARARII